jgi:predicted DNA-binding protein with PD1-like motif
MNDNTVVENGSMGRVAYARIAPNEDLVLGVEKLCLAEGFRNAFVRGALGSLVDGCLGGRDGQYIQIKGPAVEIVSLAGEVRSNPDGSLRASLTGVVADPEGNVYGGAFVAGSNPICMTFEVTLEEWLPAPAGIPNGSPVA